MTDVAIIGGGFAGMSTAWALTQRGVNAVVLEREAAPGRFASGRSAGLGRQLAEDDDYYIDRDTLELLSDNGADPELLALLEKAIGDDDSMDIAWE